MTALKGLKKCPILETYLRYQALAFSGLMLTASTQGKSLVRQMLGCFLVTR